jgi:hypothetical protein
MIYDDLDTGHYHGVLELLLISWYLPAGTEENQENLSRLIRLPDGD